jgi:tRNA(Arg) A34 adenosine deaminase TadA
MRSPTIHIELPPWVESSVDFERTYPTEEDRMRLAVALARQNVERGTGGPFGAAVVERESGRLVAVGLNLVVRCANSALHAEMVALMMAQRRAGSFTLRAPGMAAHELVTSCEPCAMCLGAIFWGGVERVLCGATREDATRLRFDEGPVFPASYRYLEERGITFVRGLLRDEARMVMELYRERSGVIYNP